jgi:uncharacterized protein (DUF952 family)
VIFHLAAEADWEAARRAGAYTADSLSTEGFIHCSTPDQIVRVANARFRGRHDMVLLHIAVDRLRAPVRYENLEGGDELFPHIYGPLNIDAVARVTAFQPDADGGFGS